MVNDSKKGKARERALTGVGFPDPKKEWKPVKRTLLEYSSSCPTSFSLGEDKLRRSSATYKSWRDACIQLHMEGDDPLVREYLAYYKHSLKLANILRKDESYSQRFDVEINKQVFPG